MVTLETEHGEFRAETLTDATKAARKAAAQARRAQKRRNQYHDIALTRAKVKAWWLATFLLEGREFPSGWILHQPGSTFSPSKILPAHHSWDLRVMVETEDGQAEGSFYRHELIGTVENGSGYTIGLFIADPERPSDPPEYYAVGVHQGVLAIERFPGVLKPEQFNRK